MKVKFYDYLTREFVFSPHTVGMKLPTVPRIGETVRYNNIFYIVDNVIWEFDNDQVIVYLKVL